MILQIERRTRYEMRVITGIARGRKLKTLEGIDVRPTTDRIKEAIFSIIQFDIECSSFLDLFCGSGQMGIEALSRGASYAYFVDVAKSACEVARENLIDVGLQTNTRVANMDSLDFLKNAKYTFDIAFLDPPYNKGTIEAALPLLEPKMSENGQVLCEHEKGLVLPETVGRLHKTKEYVYGKIEVTLYKVNEVLKCQE
ncbi:MAG: 16S rRNA (guanine(966)-N(2))-methyltransferase RsmD [Oscillospiraceae bacterium]